MLLANTFECAAQIRADLEDHSTNLADNLGIASNPRQKLWKEAFDIDCGGVRTLRIS